MDSLTHAVLGAAIAEAAIGKKEGNRAVIWGAIVATLPDMDVFVARLFDPVRSLLIHRGFTHSLFFVLLMTPLLGVLLKRIYRRSGTSLRQWTIMVFLVLATHVFLDLFTTYGTGLFEPFSHYRVEWSTIGIVDFFFTVPLVMSIVILMFFRRSSVTRRITGQAGLIYVTCYLMLTVVNKFYINNIFRNQLYDQEVSYSALKTVPLPFTNFLWMGIAVQKDDYYTGYYSLFDENKNVSFAVVQKNEWLVVPLLKDRRVRNLIRFTRGYFAALFRNGELIINDLRFGRMGLSADAPYIFSFRISSDGKKLDVRQADYPESMPEGTFKNYIGRIFGAEEDDADTGGEDEE